MNRFNRLLLIVLCLLLSIAASNALCASAETPVDVEADTLRYDKETGRYQAEGNVVLRYQSLLLKGDKMWWHPETGHAEATGHAVFESDNEVLTADKFWLNLKDRVGFATNGRLSMKDRPFFLSGTSLERNGSNQYRVVDGRFTTCEGDVPSWSFGADEIDIHVGGYATASNSTFYLKEVPVFYSPRFAYPVNPERKSGFLTPEVGFSDRNGAQLSVAWYQVLADNQDATLYLDTLSRVGLGTGVEYRYLFAEDNIGRLKGYAIFGLADDADNQQAASWQHAGHLTREVRLLADAEWVSQDDYFDDFGDVAEEYTQDRAESDVALTWHRDRYSLGSRVRVTKLLDHDNSRTLQRLPEVQFNLLRQPVGNLPIYTLLDSGATYFYRKKGERGHRFTVRPALAATVPVSVFELEGEIGWLQRYYQSSRRDNDNKTQGNVDASLRLSTRLSRSYDSPRLLHSIEPEMRYDYRPDVDEADLPFFDSLDRQGPENLVSVGVINRLTHRSVDPNGTTNYLEWLYLRLTQGYDFHRDDEGNHLLPLRAEMVLRPTEQVYLDIDTRYSLTDTFLARFTAETGVDDLHGNRLSAGYRFQKSVVDYVYARADVAWLAPVYLRYEQRLDLLDGTDNLEQRLRAEYRHQCWSLYTEVADRGDDQSFMLGFRLSGVSSVDGFGGTFEEGR